MFAFLIRELREPRGTLVLKSRVRGSNVLKCTRVQIGIKRAKVRCAPRRPLKGHRLGIKRAKYGARRAARKKVIAPRAEQMC